MNEENRFEAPPMTAKEFERAKSMNDPAKVPSLPLHLEVSTQHTVPISRRTHQQPHLQTYLSIKHTPIHRIPRDLSTKAQSQAPCPTDNSGVPSKPLPTPLSKDPGQPAPQTQYTCTVIPRPPTSPLATITMPTPPLNSACTAVLHRQWACQS